MFLSWGLLEEDAGCSLGRADAGDVGSHAVAGSDSEPVEEPAEGEEIAAVEGSGHHSYNIGLGVILTAGSEVGTVDCLLSVRHDPGVRETGVVERHGLPMVNYSVQVPGEGLALLGGEEAMVVDQLALTADSHSCLALVEVEVVLDLQLVGVPGFVETRRLAGEEAMAAVLAHAPAAIEAGEFAADTEQAAP